MHEPSSPVTDHTMIHRHSLVFSAFVLLVACGGRSSSPTSPTPTTPTTTSGFGTLTPTGPLSVNFSGCLARAASNCFSSGPVNVPTAGATATIAPAAPSNFSASASGSTVTLHWSAPSSGDAVTSYVIEAGSSPGLANLANFWTLTTSTTFSASGVAAGTYYVRIRATNSGFAGGGTSDASNEAVLTVGAVTCVAPGAPSNLRMTANAGGVVVLAWSAADGNPTSYLVEAGTGPGLSDLANRNLGSAGTGFTITEVAAGTYYVRLRATNSCGTSSPSNELTVTAGGAAPTPPTTTPIPSGTGTTVTTRIIGLSGSLAFGNVQVGSSATRTLTISNSGSSTLTWSGLSTGTAAVTASATSGTVAAGGSATVTLTFTPSATTYSGTVTVTSDATSGTNTIAFSGTGVAPTRIIELSGSLAFGTVTVGFASPDAVLWIHNGGNGTLTMNGLTFTPPVITLNGSTADLVLTLQPGATLGRTVKFAPAAATVYSGTITVSSDATSGTNSIGFSGTGVAPAVGTRILGLSGDLAFGNVAVGSSATRTLTISNSGDSTLTFSSIDNYAAGITISPRSGTVAAGGSATVTLTFAPTAALLQQLSDGFSMLLYVTSDKTSGTNTIVVSGRATP